MKPKRRAVRPRKESEVRFECKVKLWHGGWNWTHLSVDIPRAMLSQFADGDKVCITVERLPAKPTEEQT